MDGWRFNFNWHVELDGLRTRFDMNPGAESAIVEGELFLWVTHNQHEYSIGGYYMPPFYMAAVS